MKKLFLLSLTFLAFVSCETSDVENQINNPSTAHIYAVGANGNSEGFINKDGVYTSLGTNYLPFDVFVSGNDIYTCGNKDNIAAYSKNGMFTLLSSTSGDHAYKMFVKDNDVYIVGQKDNHPAYWKNGILTYLNNDPNYTGVAYDIEIINNDVYIAGCNYPTGSSNYTIAYWKNGNITTINSNHTYSCGYVGEVSIAVNNNDVYLSVNERDGSSSIFNSNAYLIKNGVIETLIASNAEVHDIYISNGDIYLCGDKIDSQGVPNKSVVWKNGNSVTEKNVEHGAFTSMYVSNNNIFAVGIESNLVSPNPLPFGTRENHGTTLINNVFSINPDFGAAGIGYGFTSMFVTE